jgi:hypothetical protein
MARGGLVAGYFFLFLGTVYFYYNNYEFRHNINYYNEWLEGLCWSLCGIDFSVLDFAGSLLCCLRYRSEFKTAKSWLEVLFSVTLMQFGGTTIAGILLGQVPSWMMSRSAFPSLVLAWWIVFNFPLDFAYTFLKKNLLGKTFMFFVGILAYISAAHAIGSWGIDKAIFNDFHTNSASMWKAYVIVIFTGTISASGGGILADVLGFFHSEPGKSLTLTSTSNLFTINRFDVSAAANRAFWLSIFYYYFLQFGADLSNAPTSLLANRVQGHSLLSIVYVITYLMQRQVDFDPFLIWTKIALFFGYFTRVIVPHYYDKFD